MRYGYSSDKVNYWFVGDRSICNLHIGLLLEDYLEGGKGSFLIVC